MSDLGVQYQRAAPTSSQPEVKVHGGPDPKYFGIYRVEQGVDVVKNLPASIDRVQNSQLHVTITELRLLCDGSEHSSALPSCCAMCGRYFSHSGARLPRCQAW
jgi:hypothetical protein